MTTIERSPAPAAEEPPLIAPVAAVTEPGKRLVALAEDHATTFAAGAAVLDREGAFAAEHLEALEASGFLYAPLPVECGGLGVESAHDVLLASSRLARGDAGLTVGVNMHLITLLNLVRQRRTAINRGSNQQAAALDATFATMVREGWVIAAAVSEPDQDLLRPGTTARRSGSGWIVEGRKIITSLAPAATHFGVSVTVTDDEGVDRYAYIMVPRDAPGITVHDDWDALGLRDSGSVTVTFTGCFVEGRGPGKGDRAGVFTLDFAERGALSGLAHASASVGIAEAAYDIANAAVVERARKRGESSVRATVRHLAAENVVELSAMRAVFAQALRAIDAYNDAHPAQRGTFEEANALFATAQSAKAFINQAAVHITDRALTMVGGAAFMNRHPLSRLYRDARGGAFMHPLAANTVYEYLGEAVLGLEIRL